MYKLVQQTYQNEVSIFLSSNNFILFSLKTCLHPNPFIDLQDVRNAIKFE